MATRLPTGQIMVEKNFPGVGKIQKKCIYSIHLRDAFAQGFTRVQGGTEAEEEVLDLQLPEEVHDIETEEQLKEMTKETLLDWALSYGVDIPNRKPKEDVLELCLSLRNSKIEQGVV